jgi:transmembrane sensor
MAEDGDLFRRIARACGGIDPGLNARDVDRLVAGARRKRVRRVLARAGGGALLAGVAAAVLLLGRGGGGPAPLAVRAVDGVTRWSAPESPRSSPSPTAAAAATRVLRLADGSSATPADDRGTLAVIEDTPRRVVLDLVAGRARFDVVPARERAFIVQAGDVTVTVVGTVFSVDRVADRIGIGVERGRVLVDWGVGRRSLGAGETGWFPPLVVGASPPLPGTRVRHARVARAAPVPPAPDAPVPPAPDAPVETVPLPRPAPSAPGAPAPPPAAASAREETAEHLFAAADAARREGRADDAARVLGRLVARHRTDPRAPLAAFTLGRVLLKDLGRPREAATAFADARALAPSGPFAEDALAREAEAWSRAGQAEQARARARAYLELHPDGRRVGAMKALAGDGE